MSSFLKPHFFYGYVDGIEPRYLLRAVYSFAQSQGRTMARYDVSSFGLEPSLDFFHTYSTATRDSVRRYDGLEISNRSSWIYTEDPNHMVVDSGQIHNGRPVEYALIASGKAFASIERAGDDMYIEIISRQVLEALGMMVTGADDSNISVTEFAGIHVPVENHRRLPTMLRHLFEEI